MSKQEKWHDDVILLCYITLDLNLNLLCSLVKSQRPAYKWFFSAIYSRNLTGVEGADSILLKRFTSVLLIYRPA